MCQYGKCLQIKLTLIVFFAKYAVLDFTMHEIKLQPAKSMDTMITFILYQTATK